MSIADQWGSLPAGRQPVAGFEPVVARSAPETRRRRLGEVLIEQGVLSDDQLQRVLAEQLDPSRPTRPRLGRLIVDMGLASERQVAAALAAALGLETVDLGVRIVDPEVARKLPKALAERHGVALLARDRDTATLGVVDPTNVFALDDVRMQLGVRELTLMIVTESQLADYLARLYSIADNAGEFVTLLDSLDDGSTTTETDLDSAVDSAPVVKLVEVLIADAVAQRASDVHVEPELAQTRVRFRVDGLLRDVMTVPRSAHAALVSRMKILAGLDIAERRKPQDGRARLGVGGKRVEARVSTLPSMHGETIVLRLLARAADIQQVEDIGLDEMQREQLREAIDSPQGLVIITGPTGSGKTSSLYALLTEANTPERNIITLEDPVEIAMPGITQVQVHERSGLTWTRGLRSILRQDPDMVLVGEVRDAETAELALQASLTGHLVLTTLHTNDAVAALTRLVDMGVEPFLVASSLTLVAAQRLVRRPCADCAKPYVPSGRTLALLGLSEADLAGLTPMTGAGCNRCGGTGYRGRRGVFEVLPITAAIRSVLLSTPTEAAVTAAARAAGVRSLRAAALEAAGRGETTYEEVLRVTSGGSSRAAPRRCRGCDRPMPEDLTDEPVCCPWCGTEAEIHACPGCQRKTNSGWRTCPYCRTPLATSVTSGLPRVLAVGVETSPVRAQLDLAGRAELESASSAHDALRIVAGGGVDLLVIDAVLPDMTGLDLLRVLHEDPSAAAVRSLLVCHDEEAAGAARRLGATVLAEAAVERQLTDAVTALLPAAG